MDSKIIKKLDIADIVSFDVFDTLITRCVLHPVDVFSLVQLLAEQKCLINFDFRNERIIAEKELAQKYGKCSYSINEIYYLIKIRNHLSEDVTHNLLSIEIEAEKKLTYPREDVKDLFFKLYKSGKKIILVSDMYLSSDNIKSLLKECGYPESLEIYVSNEYNAGKSDGTLWKIIKSKYSDKKILHFGDDKISDCISAKKNNISTYLINNPFDKCNSSPIYSLLKKYDTGDFSNSLLLGNLFNKTLFNSAFSNEYNSNSVLGIWNGSVLSCFMRWLINNQDDSLLLFVTRECYVFQPMYLEYCKYAGIETQKNCLFYASRQAVSASSIESINDIEDLCRVSYNGSLNTFMKSRCGWDKSFYDEKIVIDLPKDKDVVLNAAKKYIDDIVLESVKRREIYMSYINDCCKKFDCQKLTVVDIGYQGTTQYFLTKIWGEKISGKYFILSNDVIPIKYGCNCSSLASISSAVHPLYDNLAFFESSLQVPYGQLLEIKQDQSGNFEPICNKAKQTSQEILNGQKEYIKFAKYDAEWYGYLNGDYDYPLSLAEDIWMGLVYYNYLPASFMNSFSLDDDYSGCETWKYNPKTHCMESKLLKVPFIFYKSHDSELKKQRLKNCIKNHAPSFLYNSLKFFWIKFIK